MVIPPPQCKYETSDSGSMQCSFFSYFVREFSPKGKFFKKKAANCILKKFLKNKISFTNPS